MDQFEPLPPGDDSDRGSILLRVLVAIFVLALGLTFVRIWTRTKIAGKVGLDDFLVIIAMVCSTAAVAPFIKSVQAGLGRHINFLTRDQIVQVALWAYIAQYIVTASTLFIRLSVAFFLIRIFGAHGHWRRWLLLVAVFIVVTNILMLVLALLECQPIQRAWDPAAGGSCWSLAGRTAFTTYQGVIGMFSDWTLALLPIACLWNSPLRLRKKIAVWVLMGMGFFTGVCPLVRLVLVRNFATPDFTWVLLDQCVWAVLEMNLGLIASCIPTLKPLLQHMTGSLKSWYTKSYQSTNTGSENSQQLNRISSAPTPSATTSKTEPFSLTTTDGAGKSTEGKPLPQTFVENVEDSKQASASWLV